MSESPMSKTTMDAGVGVLFLPRATHIDEVCGPTVSALATWTNRGGVSCLRKILLQDGA